MFNSILGLNIEFEEILTNDLIFLTWRFEVETKWNNSYMKEINVSNIS